MKFFFKLFELFLLIILEFSINDFRECLSFDHCVTSVVVHDDVGTILVLTSHQDGKGNNRIL